MFRPRTGSRGFSLVELLVVTGMIALLIGLLVPSLVRARHSANQMICMSNLRQWGLATRMYANDSAGCLPRRGQGVAPTTIVNRPNDWFNALPTMLKLPMYVDLVTANLVVRPGVSSVWICPEANDPGGQYYWSYAMNMGLSVWETDQNNGQPDKITGVGDASTMVLMTDAPGSYCAVFPSVTANGYNPVPRHNGRVNICFLDGHVAPVDGRYIGCGIGLIARSDVRWHPPLSTWNGAR
jgi:prepilin-type processing-associated H-X9-DG protein